ncbi:GspE/PulE family protein [Chromobacterium amazonense]|uniref:GspE/PulE family protein n=1 Tax=Chromobacterium amazonense TaxID=1382803 RepID=UPI003F7A9AEA
MQNWFRQTHLILTVPGGRLELTANQRRMALLFSDGAMLVDASNQNDPQLISLREVARRKGIMVSQLYPVSIELIRQLYEEAEKQKSSQNSDIQDLPIQHDWLSLLREAVLQHASDIHILVNAHEADIKFRCQGDMCQVRQVSAGYGHALLAAAYNMAETADATYRLYDYQAARISSGGGSLAKGLQAVRLQLNPMGNGGRYLIARLLYAESRWEDQLTLDCLDLHPAQLRQLEHMRQMPEGVNIVSGPTGSGKSTTLKLLLETLYQERNERINILTIEDPPEYEIRGAAQLPVSNVDNEEDRGAAYRKAIVAALRSDPDVIMPGEARDREVIKLVFTAAMTGHQVWTSLHANSAFAIFDRLRDQGVESYKLTDPSLFTGLTAQRLIKRLCKVCSLPLSIGDFSDMPGFANVSEGYLQSIRMRNESGCPQCESGYVGRMALLEVVCPDQAFLDYMQLGEREKALHHWQDQLEGISLFEHGWLRMIRGELDPRDLVDRLGAFRELSHARRAQIISMK